MSVQTWAAGTNGTSITRTWAVVPASVAKVTVRLAPLVFTKCCYNVSAQHSWSSLPTRKDVI